MCLPDLTSVVISVRRLANNVLLLAGRLFMQLAPDVVKQVQT